MGELEAAAGACCSSPSSSEDENGAALIAGGDKCTCTHVCTFKCQRTRSAIDGFEGQQNGWLSQAGAASYSTFALFSENASGAALPPGIVTWTGK